jgi:RHS repeat-associated protein
MKILILRPRSTVGNPHATPVIGAARDRVIRAIACVLAPMQLFIGLPLPVLAAASQPVLAATPTQTRPTSRPSALPPDLAAQATAPWQPPEPVRSRPATPRRSIPQDRLAAPDASARAQGPGRSLPSLTAGGVIASSRTSDKELGAALSELDTWRERETFPATDAYLSANAGTSQAAALGVALGIARFEQGYFSRAIDTLQTAWTATAESKDPAVYDLANEAGIRLAGLLARVGRQKELTAVLDVLNTRRVRGPLREHLQVANEALASMRTLPEHAFKCGPLALLTLRDAWQIGAEGVASLRGAESTPAGFTLAEVADMAGKAGITPRLAFRPKGAPIIAPAVVHWRADHYAALVEKRGEHWLVRDPTFAQDFLLSAQALDDEASGYFLIMGELPAGWRSVPTKEAESVFGRGAPAGSSEEDTNNKKKCPGMAGYYVSDFLVSLHVTDTPLGYQPPVGPAIDFTLTYNQRGTFNLAGQNISHLGPQWTLNWFIYTEDADGAGNQRLYTEDGRIERYSAAQITAETPHYLTAYKMAGGSGGAPFERIAPDGTREVYDHVVTGTGPYPKRFLTKIVDRFGNEVTLTYDGSDRLTAVTDALGQVSLLSYDDPADSYRITSISDPFGRTATMTYDGSGRLASITDPVGIVSSFSYEDSSNPDFLSKLTTPYGDTNFSYKSPSPDNRAMEVKDPAGRQERVEYRNAFTDVIDQTEDPLKVPVVPTDPDNPGAGNLDLGNHYLYYGNTLKWDHKTYREYPPNPNTGLNYDKAHITKWLWATDASYTTLGVKHSEKAALGNRVWYYYDGQTLSTWGIHRGPLGVPNVVARVLDDGTTQTWRYTYSLEQEVTSAIDPKGRKTYYDRTANGIDLAAVRQWRSASSTTETLTELDWTAARLPQTTTDAALKETTFTYNAAGQPVTATNALSETTTFIYDANLDGTPDASGYLIRVEGPVSGANTSYTYDSAGRIHTVTDSEGYVLTYDYDDLNRVTVVTYPDSTYDQLVYDRLDLKAVRDREGRWTRYWYNGVGQRVLTLDPAGRTTLVDYCRCGAPKLLVDGEGNATRWEYDIQGRVTKKIYADFSETLYTYETTNSRLKTVTDALGQEKHYAYDVDDALLSTSYVNAINATPNVTFTYETDYNRLATMTDGTGTTSFTYHPVTAPTGTLGASRLAEVDGPLTDDTLVYAYDELGRRIGRTINGPANSQTFGYDALGRLDSEINVLGTFTPSYAGHSNRVTSVALPSGLTTDYGYGTATQDFRLQSIAFKNGGTTLSSHAYTHSPTGRIETWSQALSGQPVLNWAYGYDRADQLTGAVKTPSVGAAQTLRYGYDRIGNRVTESSDSAVRTGVYNELNQLEGWTGGGRTRVAGTLDEPATVTVNGSPAQLGAGNSFTADVDLPVGTSTVPVAATDGSGNTRTANYSITVASGAAATYAYDDVGNLVSKVDSTGTTAYTWDAENRLIGIAYPGGASTEMTYDGLSRRVRIVEKDNTATIIDDRRFVWDGQALAERRAGDGITVERRYFSEGVQAGGNTRLYVRDHLGSVNQLIDPSSPGSPTATYNYDPFGKRVKVAGSEESDAAYTGHYYHAASELHLTLYRAYDADLGRWLSRDPIGENGGINVYNYVAGNPVRHMDPLGLSPDCEYQKMACLRGAQSSFNDQMLIVAPIAFVAGFAMGVFATKSAIGGALIGAGAWGITAVVAKIQYESDVRECERKYEECKKNKKPPTACSAAASASV